ncbi:GIY-YIG nuclease family protein [Tropicibacter sp. Alg240-R139]|uniref:GIY-YIG nuclease family protein n=1 Tax=Tropicibacter sp. Alg240-R139 TaxID=2305991 RepID=UPI0019686AB4|nr:GIY-YIG nuclease family protein [Tropicibacter sp. Alg240-R139]
MLTAEVFNWTGHVLRIPRTRLAEGLARPEARQTGVYLLLGEDSSGELAYIGETEDMAQRLSQHARERDWWDEAVLITTYGDALHKAHVKYLESNLVNAALGAGNRRLENGNKPAGASLNEAATANMESFLETLHMVLPAIKVDLFRSGRRGSEVDLDQGTPLPEGQEFILRVPKHGIEARAILANQEMIVQAGSRIRENWVGDRKHNTHYWKIHDTIKQGGLIIASDDGAVLAQPFAFSSPSAAAAVITGRAANGRTAWKTPTGQSYAEWEEERLSKGLSS